MAKHRHNVFAYQMYPVGMSDMRLIDGKVSTTWCQRQVVRANTTFNAFLLPEIPNVADDRIHVSMIRCVNLFLQLFLLLLLFVK